MSRSSRSPSARDRIAQAFTTVEDVLHVGLGVVLAAGRVALLVSAARSSGFFDHARRDYRRRVIREPVEVLSVVGNIALDRGAPRGMPMSWSAGRTAQPWAAGSYEVPSTRPLEVTLVRGPGHPAPQD